HRFLTDRLFACQLAGIDKKRIVVDPGFGFGKSLEHNIELLRDCARFAEIAPVMVGLSRKSMIGALTGRERPQERVFGSVAAAMIAIRNGASLVRVHDVAATRDALAVCNAIGQAPKGSARVNPPSARSLWDDD
ncbi:MAG: dihydropteroate synthase, partial [Dokdonella sp.]